MVKDQYFKNIRQSGTGGDIETLLLDITKLSEGSKGGSILVGVEELRIYYQIYF